MLQELALDERVEPAGRLIEHQQFGSMHEGLDETHLLLVALRQRPHRSAEIDVEAGSESVDFAARDRTADVGVVPEQTACADSAFETEFAGNEPDASAEGGSAVARIGAEY